MSDSKKSQLVVSLGKCLQLYARLVYVAGISIFRPIIIIHGSAGGFVKAYKCILHPMIRRARL